MAEGATEEEGMVAGWVAEEEGQRQRKNEDGENDFFGFANKRERGPRSQRLPFIFLLIGVEWYCGKELHFLLYSLTTP